jgi:gliding motility-associated-like protein
MRFNCLFILLFFSLTMVAQTTINRYTISSGGSSVATPSSNYMYDIGGLVVNTSNTSSGNNYTQGFEQPSRFIEITDFTPPNAFSPNDDGVNDMWIIPLPSAAITSFNVSIFNRWGDRISYIENYNNIDRAWDGTYEKSGDPVTDGTYFYIIEDISGLPVSSGWVQVIR